MSDPRRPKRLQEGPKRRPRGPKRPPRGAREAPRAPKSGQEQPRITKHTCVSMILLMFEVCVGNPFKAFICLIKQKSTILPNGLDNEKCFQMLLSVHSWVRFSFSRSGILAFFFRMLGLQERQRATKSTQERPRATQERPRAAQE